MRQDVMIRGDKFAAIRQERYLTQEEFAQRLEMSPANVRRIEQSDTSGMQFRTFRRLAALVNLSPEQLRARIGVATELPAGSKATSPTDYPRGINLEGPTEVAHIAHYHGVSAARPENRAAIGRGSTPVPAGPQRRFSATVDGDCMEPKYRHGDVVIFSIDSAEREGIIDGRNYFIQFADGENTFKRIFLDPENRELLSLHCWNKKYPPRAVERASIKLLAKATHKIINEE